MLVKSLNINQNYLYAQIYILGVLFQTNLLKNGGFRIKKMKTLNLGNSSEKYFWFLKPLSVFFFLLNFGAVILLIFFDDTNFITKVTSTANIKSYDLTKVLTSNSIVRITKLQHFRLKL